MHTMSPMTNHCRCSYSPLVVFILLVPAFAQTASAQIFSFSDQTYVGQESGGESSTLTIDVIRSGPTDSETRVQVRIQPYANAAVGTVNAQDIDSETDFSIFDDPSEAFYEVTFDVGQSTRSVAVNIHDDSRIEGDESFVIALSPSRSPDFNGTIGQLGAIRTAVVTIRDDESPSNAPPVSPPPVEWLFDEDDSFLIRGTPLSDIIEFGSFIQITTPSISEYPFPVYRDGSTVAIDGGDGDDEMYLWRLGASSRVSLFGGNGNDKLIVQNSSSSSKLTAVLKPGELYFVDNFELWTSSLVASSFESIEVTALNDRKFHIVPFQTEPKRVFDFGAGQDAAFLFDSAGNDQLTVDMQEGVLTGDGFRLKVGGFDRTVTYASTGFDTATFSDSAFDEDFVAKPDFARMTGFSDGYVDDPIDNYASGFDETIAYATSGFDTARLYDSPGDDLYTGTPRFGELQGTNLYLKAAGFDSVAAYAIAGGADAADLYDSPGDDIFVGRKSISAIFDAARSYAHTIKYFENVEAIADDGGHDQAQFYDTAGNDVFIAMPGTPTLTSQSFSATAQAFERVSAYSTNGGLDILKQEIRLDYHFTRGGDWQ